MLLLLPPIPTLFPYTTLFRSKELSDLPRARRRELVQEISEHIEEARSGLEAQTEAEMRTLFERLGEDRKSTRLNSSHLVISYAVFCLKKKTVHHHQLRNQADL